MGTTTKPSSALVTTVLLGAAAIWGFIDLRVQLGQALGGQDQTQILQQVMLDTLRVRATLTGTDAPIQQIVADIRQDIDALKSRMSALEEKT